MLKQWIISTEMPRIEMAAELQISPSYLSLLENGKKRPSLDLAFAIERLTQGKVPASSWVTEAAREQDSAASHPLSAAQSAPALGARTGNEVARV